MTSIERTAYPRFKQNISKKELATIYTVTHEENIFAHRIARGESSVFICLVMLKSFQRLEYFPRSKNLSRIFLIKSPQLPISNSVYYFQLFVRSSSTVCGNFLTKKTFVPQSSVSVTRQTCEVPIV